MSSLFEVERVRVYRQTLGLCGGIKEVYTKKLRTSSFLVCASTSFYFTFLRVFLCLMILTEFFFIF